MQKMIKFNDFTKENLKEDNLNWPQIRDDTYRIIIIRGSGSAETNSFF